MRFNRKIAMGLTAALAVAVLPSFAGASARQTSGTWTFTDVTPNPTVFGQCSGPEVPSAPVDVNSYDIKVTKKRATLTTLSGNTLDWAAEVRDSKGNVIASYDGGTPDVVENISVPLRKGTYTVYYCNWAGEPTIDVDWTLK